MKRVVILMCVFIGSFLSTVKSQENVSLNSMQYFYCQIVGTQKMLSNKVTVNVDFGQIQKLLSDQRLRDENGNVIVFNSMVDAMNWMGARGWEFVQAYVITTGNQNVYHWLLKKSTKKMSEEERKGLLEIFKTKKDFKNKEN